MYASHPVSPCVRFGNTVIYCYLWSSKSVGCLMYGSQKAVVWKVAGYATSKVYVASWLLI